MFAPDNEKYTWNVIHVEPANAPSFFTCKIKVLQRETMILFRIYAMEL